MNQLKNFCLIKCIKYYNLKIIILLQDQEIKVKKASIKLIFSILTNIF